MSEIKLLYDHFLALGGAEKVSLQLNEVLQPCQVESAWVDQSLFAEEIKTGQIINHGYGYSEHFFPTLSLFWFYLVKYPVKNLSSKVLATGVFSPLVLWRNKQIQQGVVYFHTFPSFVHSSFAELRGHHGLIGATVFKTFTRIYLWFLKRALKNAKQVWANSHSVQQRFKAIGIDTQVLYPGVDLNGLEYQTAQDYFLSCARLESNKRVDVILQAFAQLPEHKLVVVGSGSLAAELRTSFAQYGNIEFVGWQAESTVKHHYNNCRALLYLPINEYFGIAPVEAIAAGKPVIGVAEGGLLETINDQRLGTLIDGSLTIDKVKQAIIKYAGQRDNQTDIDFRRDSAKRFAFAEFATKLKHSFDCD